MCMLPDSNRTGYVSEIVTDARAYADHAGRLDIRMKDVRLASQKRQDALTPGILIRQVGVRVYTPANLGKENTKVQRLESLH